MRIKIEPGQIYGDFKIISRIDSEEKYKYVYECECINCGYIEKRDRNNIKHSKNRCKNCNSDFGKAEYKGYINDYSGMVFDKLTVISYAGKIDTHSAWLCRCECGNECIKSSNTFRQKNLACPECMKPKVKEITEVPKKTNKIDYFNEYVLINDKVKIDVEDVEKVLSYNRYISINSEGYAYFKYKQEEIFLHRLLVGLPNRYNPETKLISDHKDGDRLNNCKSNLRIVKKEINPINCKKYSNNKSGCKGVSWVERLGKWQVNLQINHKNKYLGVYEDYDEAVRVRKEAEEKYYGEYNRKDA